MILSGIKIFVGDVTDMEARVFAQYGPTADDSLHRDERIVLRGTLRGPYCEHARTLPAEFAFRDLGPDETQADAALAEAVVPDPCMWSPELPHMYHADVEALRGERIVAEYHGMIGLRRSPTPPE